MTELLAHKFKPHCSVGAGKVCWLEHHAVHAQQSSAKAFACCSCQCSTGLGRSLLTVTIFYVMSLGAVTVLQSLRGMMSMIPLWKFSLGTSGYFLSSPSKMCLFWLPVKGELVKWGWFMREKIILTKWIFSVWKYYRFRVEPCIILLWEIG